MNESGFMRSRRSRKARAGKNPDVLIDAFSSAVKESRGTNRRLLHVVAMRRSICVAVKMAMPW